MGWGRVPAAGDRRVPEDPRGAQLGPLFPCFHSSASLPAPACDLMKHQEGIASVSLREKHLKVTSANGHEFRFSNTSACCFCPLESTAEGASLQETPARAGRKLSRKLLFVQISHCAWWRVMWSKAGIEGEGQLTGVCVTLWRHCPHPSLLQRRFG